MRKVFCAVFVLSIIAVFGVYQLFFNIDNLPEGDFLTQVDSPNGLYSINAYIVNGGATVAYSVRCELAYKKESQKPRNIYWNYRENEVSINWLDNETVLINGHRLQVHSDVFDFRRHR